MNEEIMIRLFNSGKTALVFEGDRWGFCEKKDFDKIQRGFRCDSTGRKNVDWLDKYYVIGFDAIDRDLLVVDVSDKNLPILYMYQDDYMFKKLFKLASSVEDYKDIIEIISNANLHDSKETKKAIRQVNSIAPLKSHKYWSYLINLIHENLNY